MALHPPRVPRPKDRAMAATGVAVLALASPLRLLWCRPGQAWWLVFAVWGCAIAVIAWATPSTPEDDG